MNNAIRACLALAFTGAAVSGAQALTITNYDTVERTIVINEAGRSSKQSIPAGTEMTDVCRSQCTLQLDGASDTYDFQGDEIVSIEEGILYDDTPVAGDGADAGADTDFDDSAQYQDGDDAGTDLSAN